VAEVDAADDVPRRLPRNGVVLVGHPIPKWLGFDCPCRSGHRVLLNLEPTRRPHWRVLKDRQLTVSPSVDESGPQGRCHYLIERGKIVWV
jgi:hypothetical protein